MGGPRGGLEKGRRVMSVSDGEPEAKDIARRTDDALRAVLFQRVLDRLETEQKKDPTIRLFDRMNGSSLTPRRQPKGSRAASGRRPPRTPASGCRARCCPGRNYS